MHSNDPLHLPQASEPKWGMWAGQYSYDITWRGVPVTVECEVEYDELTVSRVLAGGVDISELLEDIEAGDLMDLLDQAHANRYYGSEE